MKTIFNALFSAGAGVLSYSITLIVYLNHGFELAVLTAFSLLTCILTYALFETTDKK